MSILTMAVLKASDSVVLAYSLLLSLLAIKMLSTLLVLIDTFIFEESSLLVSSLSVVDAWNRFTFSEFLLRTFSSISESLKEGNISEVWTKRGFDPLKVDGTND